MACCRPAKILLPKEGTDLAKWAVVACDQFTSEPEYWKEADELVGDAPSTLRITLPEVYLEEEGVEERVAKINKTMASYLEDGILEELPAGMMLVDRDTGGPCGRKGLVLAFDLEAYDYKAGSTSLIRPTEKTVVERIPPRLAVRRDALVELPHIMLLIDDPERTVIEPLYEKRDAFEKKYSVDLMMNGGHIDGWFIPEGEATDEVIGALDALNAPERFRERYGLTEDKPLLPFATGDGNHSMATAKAAWEEIKKDLTPEEQAVHPARYVLAELVNIHDESLEIEAIYRVLFGVDMEDVCHAAKAFFEAHGATFEEVEGVTPADAGEGEQLFPWYAGEKSGMAMVKNSPWALPVATLQAFLDDYLAAHPEAKIDYIHGVDVLKKLSAEPGNMGFWLEDPKKSDLFRGVIMDGVLPRKTFSMGEAREKRYYMEAKRSNNMIRELIRVRADGSDPYHNLAVEEYLTMHAAPGQCILFLWQNQRTVVIGKNQNAWKECDVRKLEADGGHLVRRLSGGGAVYHDLGNLNFTFCTAREDYDVSRQTDVILQAVRSLGIDAVKNGRNDLTADGRKFSGHAFLKKESHCYHHGTLMVEVDGSVLAKYLRPDPQKLAGKGVDSVRSRVVNLHELKPDLTIDQLADALTDSFAAVYGLPVKDRSETELTAREEAAQEIKDRTAFFASWEWKYGRPIPFSQEIKARFAWGDVQLRLDVQAGEVRRVALFSDGLEQALLEACGKALEGCRYDSDAMTDAVHAAVCSMAGGEDLLDPAAASQIEEDFCGLIREHMDN